MHASLPMQEHRVKRGWYLHSKDASIRSRELQCCMRSLGSNDIAARQVFVPRRRKAFVIVGPFLCSMDMEGK